MRKEKIIPDHYYHVYNRGVNYEKIFFREDNWYFFLQRVKKYFTPDKASIIAYCLMPNHYHLLVLPHTEDFGRDVMHPFSISYTKAINKEQGRIGPLFQGPFQARRVMETADLLNLSRYIHHNPVTVGFVNKPADWEFSSYNEYTGRRKGAIPKTGIILDHFKSKTAYARFVEDSDDLHIPKELLLDQ